MNASGKLRVGYFTQYQVEELNGDETPLQHMSRLMPKATPAAVRAQLGRFGFSGDKAVMRVGDMSGGERARLALALITREAPHLLILDEPTNHLDVDAREALVQALNDYRGAVVLVSHDRHMLELTADRLVLVDGGTAREYAGSLDDYTDFILGRNQDGGGDRPAAEAQPQGRAPRRGRGARAGPVAAPGGRGRRGGDRPAGGAQDARSSARCSIPPPPRPRTADRTMSELMKRLAATAAALAEAERRWLEASEAMEK